MIELDEAALATGTAGDCGCPHHRNLVRASAIAIAWVAAATGAAALVHAPFPKAESLCGPWGCLPSLSALAALHALWATLLAFGVWAVRALRPHWLRAAGIALALSAIAAAAGVAGLDLSAWLAQTTSETAAYWPRRIAFKLATTTELPMTQAALAGLAAWLLGRRPMAAPASCAARPNGGSEQ